MKRLFLADTQMQSEGAIALAEFLPEARTLLHIVSALSATLELFLILF